MKNERTYRRILTKNSNNARRRGLCGLVLNKFKGELEWRDHVSVTLERGGDIPSGMMHSPAVLRSMRSKYVPHVGKKHAAKLAIR